MVFYGISYQVFGALRQTQIFIDNAGSVTSLARKRKVDAKSRKL